MIVLALAALAGVICIQFLPGLPGPLWLLSGLPLLAGAHLGRSRFLIVTGVFWIAACWAVIRASLILADALPPELEGRDLTVHGVVAGLPQATGHGWRFDFDVDRAWSGAGPAQVPTHVRLTAHGDKANRYRPGQRWQLTVRLKRPHGMQNPGGFDYEAWLFRKGIRATGYVRPRPESRLLQPDPPAYGWLRIRAALSVQLAALLGERAGAGVVRALAVGDRAGLSAGQWRLFRDTGTSHLMAISGLHIGLVAGLGMLLGRRIWSLNAGACLRLPAQKAGAATGLVLAVIYAALAGFAIPTQRALIMLLAVTGGLLIGRAWPLVEALALALLLVLLHDPLAVLEPGFWLSFMAVAVIALGLRGRAVCSGRNRPVPGTAWLLLKTQWLVFVGLLPCLLFWFQLASVTGLLANIVMIPLFSFAVVPLVLLAASLSAWPVLASPLLSLAATLVEFALAGLERLAALEPGIGIMGSPPVWAWGLAALSVFWLLAPRGWPARWLGVVWLIPLIWPAVDRPEPGELWLTMLDVGQGLALVARTREHALLFDTGARYSERFDMGQAVVLPYLRHVGIAKLDRIIISHGDNDHRGGLAAVRTAHPEAEVLTSVPRSLPNSLACHAGQHWRWDRVEFRILHPGSGDTALAGGASRQAGGNDASCVLRIRAEGATALLPGDIEAAAEAGLLRRLPGLLRADILVAPHHGSKTSSTAEFLRAVSPSIVLFPVGYRNRYHHPHPEVLARYRQQPARIYASPDAGAVELRVSAAGTKISEWRKIRRRYWHHRGGLLLCHPAGVC